MKKDDNLIVGLMQIRNRRKKINLKKIDNPLSNIFLIEQYMK